ncbi:TPA: hypothetical protein DEO28_04765 [Candidatus Dependentiae bacterium]|nr:MAG: hypothetical protein UR14_C0002G0067 [candidate division TM6 bacterium GW2011_GWE2_31_21]KKP53864.1 MAG: hypothetical protein UR43_C0002G0067 [candidate division TM6 bacterium GW2011_GWF2_33_332]HBS47644.1 hypothetical protein [Candidatus Dependentiae bacterium]HBZ73793.1 hypothetical protein [Candidatus Dependentiae bacterium]
MLKKILIFIIIALISIQIPLIISLSTASEMTKKLEFYQSKIAGVTNPMKAVTDVVSFPVKAVTSIFPFFKEKKSPVLDKIDDISPMIIAGEQKLKDAIVITKKMTFFMHISLFLTLFLIILLFAISRKSFIKNLGASLLLNGIICLIVLASVYYFFIINFDSTFQHFYNRMVPAGPGSMIPMVPEAIKSAAKDFVSSIAHLIIKKNMLSSLIGIPLGLALIYLNNFISKKFNLDLSK